MVFLANMDGLGRKWTVFWAKVDEHAAVRRNRSVKSDGQESHRSSTFLFQDRPLSQTVHFYRPSTFTVSSLLDTHDGVPLTVNFRLDPRFRVTYNEVFHFVMVVFLLLDKFLVLDNLHISYIHRQQQFDRPKIELPISWMVFGHHDERQTIAWLLKISNFCIFSKSLIFLWFWTCRIDGRLIRNVRLLDMAPVCTKMIINDQEGSDYDDVIITLVMWRESWKEKVFFEGTGAMTSWSHYRKYGVVIFVGCTRWSSGTASNVFALLEIIRFSLRQVLF